MDGFGSLEWICITLYNSETVADDRDTVDPVTGVTTPIGSNDLTRSMGIEPACSVFLSTGAAATRYRRASSTTWQSAQGLTSPSIRLRDCNE